VIIILAPSAQISGTEQQLILNLLREIKKLHPGNQIFMLHTLISLTVLNIIIYISVITDLYFIYYTSQRNSHLFQSFILSEQDRLILSPNIDAIAQHLSTGIYPLNIIRKELIVKSGSICMIYYIQYIYLL
jgi:hypothetical protein